LNSIKFSAAVCSNKGKIRNNNEDNFYFNGKHLNSENRDLDNFFEEKTSSNSLIYGVFDGMGGEALGEEASLITAETVKKHHKTIRDKELADYKSEIIKAIDEANEKICDKMLEFGEKRIGTTFASVVIDNDKASIFNIGDSRVYLFRDNKLTQISIDDTTAQRLINMGVISKEEAKTHADRHKLTQHLGIFSEEMIIEPHISENVLVKKGDVFLICSDGLTDMVNDSQIRTILSKSKNSSMAAKKLVETALNNGGKDNVTAMVVEAETKSTIRKEKANKKKLASVAIVAIGLIVLFVGAYKMYPRMTQPKYIEATEIRLDEENYSAKMKVGEVCYPMPQRFPAVNKENNEQGETKFVYKSSDSSIVSVDNQRQCYKALKPGKATIIVSMDEATKEIVVEVLSETEDIVINKKTLFIKKNEKSQIEYEVQPEECSLDVQFDVRNESVATVDEHGVVTALSEGETVIDIKSGEIVKQVKVVVTQNIKNQKTNDKKSINTKEEDKNDREEKQESTKKKQTKKSDEENE